ncbi:22308_t:CDS:2, partial [Racocetra persica]
AFQPSNSQPNTSKYKCMAEHLEKELAANNLSHVKGVVDNA